jgi:hypothetical protein
VPRPKIVATFTLPANVVPSDVTGSVSLYASTARVPSTVGYLTGGGQIAGVSEVRLDPDTGDLQFEDGSDFVLWPNRAADEETPASDDVIATPENSVWRLILSFDAQVQEEWFLSVPDVDTELDILAVTITRPASIPPAGTNNATLGGMLTGTIDFAEVKPRVLDESYMLRRTEALLTNQRELLGMWFAAVPMAKQSGVHVYALNAGDSFTQPWSHKTVFESYFEQQAGYFRSIGIPCTTDWVPALRPIDLRWTTNVADAEDQGDVLQHGLGLNGLIMQPGDWYELEVEDCDGFEVFVTRAAAGVGSLRVLLDGVEEQIATTTLSASTPSGHHKLYRSDELDPDVTHTIRYECTVNPVKLDGTLVHHGTWDHGIVMLNGAHNGTDQLDHLSQDGYLDCVQQLGTDLALVFFANTLISYINGGTAESTLAALESGLDAVSLVTMADKIVIKEYEPSGAFGVLASDGLPLWDGWDDEMSEPMKELAGDYGAAYIDMSPVIRSKSRQPETDQGIDLWTWPEPIDAATKDYLHGNHILHGIAARSLWGVIGHGLAADALPSASALKVVSNVGPMRIESPDGWFFAVESFDNPFLINLATVKIGLTANPFESFQMTLAGVSTVNPATGVVLGTMTWSDAITKLGGITAFAQTLLDDVNQAAMQATLGFGLLGVRNSIAGAAPLFDLGQSRTGSAAELTLLSAVVPIAANSLVAGDLLRFEAQINNVNLSGGALTDTLRLKIGTITSLNTGALSVANFTGQGHRIKADILIESISPTPITRISSSDLYGITQNGPATSPPIIADTANTPLIDATTGAINIDVTSQHSTASGSFVTELLWARLTRESRY